LVGVRDIVEKVAGWLGKSMAATGRTAQGLRASYSGGRGRVKFPAERLAAGQHHDVSGARIWIDAVSDSGKQGEEEKVNKRKHGPL